MKNFKRVMLVTVAVFAMALVMVGCGSSDSKEQKKSADKTVAIEAGDNQVFLDEVRYYMYSSQGTYEIYYIADGKEIDWGEKNGKTTWENTVKGSVLDSIAKRECFYEQRDEYNIQLDDKAKQDIDLKVANYYTGTDEKLKNKINIKESKLTALFTKAYIATMIEDIMNTTEKGSADKYYKSWLEKNDIECENAYFTINFDEHIFTRKDMNITVNEDTTGETGEKEETSLHNPAENGDINVNQEEVQ